MAKKEDNFDDLDFSAVEEQDNFDDLDFGAVDDEISKVETAALAGGQGLTMGMLDELYGMFAAEGGASPRQVIQDPEAAIEQERKMMESYEEERDVARKRIKEAKKENPGTAIASELVGGLIPAAFTGGGSAVAKTGAALAGKAPMVKSLGGLAKEGAKFGGAYGFGESEGEGLGELALDTGVGATTGAIAAPALSLGVKAGSKGAKKIGEGLSDLAEKFPTLSKPFKFAKEHGMTSGKERSKIMEDDVKTLLEDIKKAFKDIGMDDKLAAQKAAKAEETINLTGDLQAIANGLKEEAGMLTGAASNKIMKMADQVETMAIGSQAKAAQKLVDQTKDEIQKKMDASARKETIAPIKAESKIAKHVLKSGDELDMIQEGQFGFDDLAEIPWDTKGGKLSRSRAKFSEDLVDEAGVPFKQSYEKQFIDDTTPFSPSSIKVGKDGDKIVAQYMNEATGEVFNKYGALPPEGLNFEKMDIDTLQNWVRVVGKKAFDKADPEKDMYVDLWKLGREKITELLPLLSEKKAGQAKLYQLMDILNIDKSVINKQMSHSDMVKLLKGLPSKLGTEKDYLQRHIVKEGDDLSRSLDKLELTADVDQILEGSMSHTGEFTRAGIMQKASGILSEGAGSLYGKGERVAKMLTKPASAVADMSSKLLSKMSPERLNQFRTSLLNKENKGLQMYADELERLVNSEPESRDKIMFSLSQSPAFRKSLGKFLKEMDEDMSKDLGMPESDLNQLLDSYKGTIEPEREPDSVEEDKDYSQNIDKDLMHRLEGFREKGYIPKSRSGRVLGKSGVTIANALDLGQRDNLNDLDLDPMIKEKLTPYLGKKKQEADDFLAENPLDLSGDINENGIVDAEEVENATAQAYYDKVESNFNRNNKHDKEFDDLPDPVKTVLYSKQFQTGKLGNNLINAASNDEDYSDVVNTLKNSTNTRRQEEGIYLEQKLEELQQAKDRETKQLGSGALPGTERSSLDDLMGKLQGLDVDETERSEMEEAAFGGDMNKLQLLIDQYKGTIA